MGAVQRISDRLGRTRPRSTRTVIPGEAQSPMDRNPTLVVSAAVIASCVRDAQELRKNAVRGTGGRALA